ncbi:hypothetical protein V5799_020009 [Amblyomma americanum]|uniref:Reverse transcriptase domain-containing protein n=1 Tax=Amblyomma americanum TaxID=6943 RepID=A0AAQ4EV49_AMBAM
MLPAHTAPGPDGLTGRDLREIPVAPLLVLLDILMLTRHLPVCLRNARIVFLPKIPGADTATQFRPITISSVLVRLFHKILANRLLAEIQLDCRQRAFLPVDGCAEKILLLSTALKECKSSCKPLYMASLDLTKAFDSVAVDAIFRGAAVRGCGQEILTYLEEFYQTTSTVLEFEGMQPLVHPSRGVRQGDPLSPLLVNLVLDEWLRADNHGKRIDDFVAFLDERGLAVNPAKSLTVALQSSGREKKVKLLQNMKFLVKGAEIVSATTGTEWRSLEACYAPFGQKRPSVVAALTSLLDKVSVAPLWPQERLVALRYYLLPHLYHQLSSALSQPACL